MNEEMTDQDRALIRLVAFGSKNARWKHVRQMRNKIEGVAADLRRLRRELPEQHWLKADLLTNETLLRLALVEADKAGLKEDALGSSADE